MTAALALPLASTSTALRLLPPVSEARPRGPRVHTNSTRLELPVPNGETLTLWLKCDPESHGHKPRGRFRDGWMSAFIRGESTADPVVTLEFYAEFQGMQCVKRLRGHVGDDGAVTWSSTLDHWLSRSDNWEATSSGAWAS